MSTIVDIGRDKTTIKLFDTKGGEVTLYTSLTFDEQKKLLEGRNLKDQSAEEGASISIDTIRACFISWNIGKDGKPYECNAETLGRFTQRDFLAILQACTGQSMIDENGNILAPEFIAKKG